MTWREDMAVSALLLVPLILYGLVPVWAQDATADTAGDPYQTQSTVMFNILQGENYSIMLNTGQKTSTSPSLTTHSDSSTQLTVRNQDRATTLLSTTHQITESLSHTSQSLSVELPPASVGNTTADEDTTSATCATGESKTGIPPTTSRNTTNNPSAIAENSTNTPTGKSKNSTDTPTVTSGSSASISSTAFATSTGTSSGTMTDSLLPVTPNKPIASLRTSGHAVVNPRTVKRTARVISTTGRVSLSVKIRSSVSKDEAIRKLSRKVCELIVNTPQLEGVWLSLGPDRTRIMCLGADV